MPVRWFSRSSVRVADYVSPSASPSVCWRRMSCSIWRSCSSGARGQD